VLVLSFKGTNKEFKEWLKGLSKAPECQCLDCVDARNFNEKHGDGAAESLGWEPCEDGLRN